MSTVIQNIACLELILNPSDKIIKFKKETLIGKKITSIYLYSGLPTNAIRLPWSDEALSYSDDLNALSMFLTLQDMKQKVIVKDFSLENFHISVSEHKFIEHKIDSVLDLDQCFLTYKNDGAIAMKFLMFVFYETHNTAPIDDTVNGSVTIHFPTGANFKGNYNLNEFVNFTLKGKQIKKIIPVNCFGYLNLICKNNIFEYIPAMMLQAQSTKEFYFDNIEIDYELSSYYEPVIDTIAEIENAPKRSITFIY
ncbi:MAG: hypothetical protein WCL70_07975 [Paludibacter sp.]